MKKVVKDILNLIKDLAIEDEIKKALGMSPEISADAEKILSSAIIKRLLLKNYSGGGHQMSLRFIIIKPTAILSELFIKNVFF